MFTRRDALKLGAAGLATPLIRWRDRPAAIMAQEPAVGWPMYGGNPARTGLMPGTNLRFDLPLVVRWEWSTISAGGWTRPVVHAGMIYQSPGDQTGLLARDFETGEERWRALPEQLISAHVVLDDSLYVATTDTLHALDTVTGQAYWSISIEGIHGHAMVAADGTVYCRSSYDGIVAVNASDGARRWVFDERAEDTSPLTALEGVLYVGSINGALVAIETATGAERWRKAIPSGEYGEMSRIIAADDRLYFRNYQGDLSAIDPESGTELWLAARDSPFLLSAAHHNRVYGSAMESVYALDGATGEELWTFSTPLTMSVSGIYGDTVLVQGTAGMRDMWWVHGLDAATGEELWSFETYPRMYDPTVIGDRLMMNGLVGWVLANPLPPTLAEDVDLRGAPTPAGIVQGTARRGTEITSVGEQVVSNGEPWVRVTIGILTGWIPLSAIDPATLPLNGEVRTVYAP